MANIKAAVNPSITNVRALVTTKWGNSGYRPIVMRNIETYFVDTALDSDADGWRLEIGDPHGQYMEMLDRDNEVRVQLFGYGPKRSEPIITGIADTIEFDEGGTMAITGRDLSSIATDSILLPGWYRHVRAHALVKKQAVQLGFRKTNLSPINGDGAVQSFKRQYADGSESYWEFWYRLYRKEKMWIWTEPDGTLTANTLNYSQAPQYYFGTPRKNDPASLRARYLPVEHIGFSKNIQPRVGNVRVYGHHGDNGFSINVEDTHTRGWLKRPVKLLLDTDAINTNSAKKLAWEEIFEGKVGEIECRLVIPDPGYEIHQNKIAVVRIPELDYANTMFVVGVRRSGGRDGATLEIRLRERQYAISRRVPKDPKPPVTPGKTVTTDVGAQLPSIAEMPKAWGQYFINAANKYHGQIDYTLFLATLLAICDQETKFQNIRRYGGPGGSPEWYPWKSTGSLSPQQPNSTRDAHGRSLDEWKTCFANTSGDGYVNEDYAVGPMQLLSSGYKNFADNQQKDGQHDEFWGGRWNPQWNILGGAYALDDKIRNTTGGTEGELWVAVGHYGEGTTYAQSVKSKVYDTPGYLKEVQDALSEAKAAAKTDPGDSSSDDPGGGNNSPGDVAGLTWINKADSGVDLVHVNWTLLSRINSLGASIGHVITATSGFRTFEHQQELWDRYVRSGYDDRYIAARPGTSNHEKGEAVDCTVGSTPMGTAVSGAQLAIHGLHCPVLIRRGTDAVHTTRLEVWG